MKALLVVIMGLSLNISHASAQEADTTRTSIQAKELDEVIVKASYLTREADHILAHLQFSVDSVKFNKYIL